jgi:hypothetical protein
MKITKEKFKKILLEEYVRFTKGLNQEQQRATEERKLAHTLYVFLNEIRDRFEQYLGTLPEGEEPSDEFRALFDNVAKMWALTDDILETSKQTPSNDWTSALTGGILKRRNVKDER